MSDDEDQQRQSMSSVIVLGVAGLNFHQWDDDFQSALGLKKLQRFVERKEKGDGEEEAQPKKPKPLKGAAETEDAFEKRLEKWEDDANMVLGILRKSLGDHKTLIKGIKDPLEAYETITKQFSGETEYDTIDLIQRFTKTKPKGDDLLGYINEMQHLQTTLTSLKVPYSEPLLIGTMLLQLKDYEIGHPFRTLYNDLAFKYKDKPQEVTMALFRRFAKSTIREVTMEARDAKERVKVEEESGSALAIKNASGGRASYVKTCRFCKSPNHEYDDCDDPTFDSDWKKKQRNAEKGNRTKNGKDDGGQAGRANVVVDNAAYDSEIELYENSAVLAVLQQSQQPSNNCSTKYIDSGSTWSILSDQNIFKHCARPLSSRVTVIVGNGARLQAEVMGDVLINIEGENGKMPVILKKCFFIPELCTNLISVGRLTEEEYTVHFDGNTANIRNTTGTSIPLGENR